ncbi:hypothetical protein TYRP_003417, partial [Tyrophagus putrescentiae]
IVAQNKFWCPYLTFFYTLYLLESCYYTYGFFFNKNNTIGFFLRIFFAVGAVYFLGMLVFVTWQCSKVVFQNCQIQKTAQKLAIRFSLVYQLSIHEMMTIDAIAANYRYVKKVSFKLLNNYRVDSRMFQQEISAHSKLWKNNLTVFYLIYLVNSSYYAYAIFIDDGNHFSFYSKIYFAIITFEYLFMLVFVTWQCSKIVLLNCRIHKTKCKLGVRFTRVYQLSFHEIMTIDAITAENRIVKKVTFKLFNNYRIDIQMFEVLLTYSTTIFLMVFGS